MPSHRKKKTHEDYLKCVCLLCMQKCQNSKPISDQHYNTIERFVVGGLDKNDPRLPKVLCMSCIRVLYYHEENEFSRTIKVFDYSKLRDIKTITRSKCDCSCYVCAIGRYNSIGKSTTLADSSDTNTCNFKETKSVIKLCTHCLCEISRGKSHHCTITERRYNLIEMLVPSKTSEQAIAHCLKEKASKNDSNSFTLSQPGPSLRCIINPVSNDPPVLKVEDILTMKSNLNIGVNTTLKMAKELRFGLKNRNIVEPGLKDALIQKNKLVDEMFAADEFDFVNKGSVVRRPIIYCHDTRKLLHEIIQRRDLEFQKMDFKIGVDGGGGFLKICQNVIRQEEQTRKKRRLFNDGIEGSAHTDTSVHKLAILAIVPDVPETYENISQLWKMINLEPLEEYGDVKMAADLKLCNMMLGLQSHASNHPCSWCNIEK